MIKKKLIFGAGLLFVLTSCGGLKKGKIESSQTAQGGALNFQIWVLTGDRGEAQSFVAQQDQMVLPQTFRLSDLEGKPRGLSIAWSEALWGTLILDAHFSHRAQNALNQNQGEPERWSASWDQENRRWFVSLSEFFKGRESELNPADVHWFSFDFLLKEGSHRTLQLGLKLLGPAPRLRYKFLEPSYPSEPSRLIQAFYSSWSFHEQWENLSDRKLTLWLLPEEKTGLQFRTELTVPRYVEKKNQEPSGPFPEYHESRVPLALAALKVSSGNDSFGGFYSFPRSVKKVNPWIKLELGARETVNLEWKVSPGQKIPRCQVPEPEVREFHWKLIRCGLFFYLPLDQCHHPPGPELPSVFTKKITEDWSITSALVEGAFKRTVRVSDPVIELPEEGVLESDQIPIRVLSGENPHSAKEFFCQGIF